MTTLTPNTALAAAASGGLAAFATADNPFTNRAREEGVQDGIFIRFNGNTGEFICSSGDKLEHGTMLAFHLMHAQEAWQGFDRANNNKGVKGPMTSILSGQRLPDPVAEAQQYPDAQWQRVIRVLVRTLDGAPQMLLSAKAEKPKREIWRLVKKFGALMGRYRDEKGKNKIPIVTLGARSFKMDVDDENAPPLSNGKQPKINVTKWAEKYEIVDWLSEAELAQIEAEANEAEGAGEQQEPQQAGLIQSTAPTAAPTAPPQLIAAPQTPPQVPQAPPPPPQQQQPQPQLQTGPQQSFRRGRIGGRTIGQPGQSTSN